MTHMTHSMFFSRGFKMITDNLYNSSIIKYRRVGQCISLDLREKNSAVEQWRCLWLDAMLSEARLPSFASVQIIFVSTLDSVVITTL